MAQDRKINKTLGEIQLFEPFFIPSVEWNNGVCNFASIPSFPDFEVSASIELLSDGALGVQCVIVRNITTGDILKEFKSEKKPKPYVMIGDRKPNGKKQQKFSLNLFKEAHNILDVNGKLFPAKRDERWCRLRAFPDYFVSSTGRVLREEFLLVAKPQKHAMVHLRQVDGSQFKKKVAKLVAAAFFGARPEGKLVWHKDGDLSNCCANNLEYKTQHEAYLAYCEAHPSLLRPACDVYRDFELRHGIPNSNKIVRHDNGKTYVDLSFWHVDLSGYEIDQDGIIIKDGKTCPVSIDGSCIKLKTSTKTFSPSPKNLHQQAFNLFDENGEVPSDARWRVSSAYPGYALTDATSVSTQNLSRAERYSGFIVNLKTMTILDGAKNNGYPLVSIQNSSGKNENKLMSHLVLEYFGMPPMSKDHKHVNHKYGSATLDNSLENLEWCTHAENMHHKNITGFAGNPRDTHAVEQAEKTTDDTITLEALNADASLRWLPISHEIIDTEQANVAHHSISDSTVKEHAGLLKSPSGKIFMPIKSKKGYLIHHFLNKSVLVHRLIAAAIYGLPNDEHGKPITNYQELKMIPCEHLGVGSDGKDDKTDNRSVNIRWGTAKSNIERAHGNAIRVISRDGDISDHPSIKEASRQLGLCATSLTAVSSGRSAHHKGFIVLNVKDGVASKPKRKRRAHIRESLVKIRKVIRGDGTEFIEFESQAAAAASTAIEIGKKCSPQNVGACCLGKLKTYRGFTWKFKE